MAYSKGRPSGPPVSRIGSSDFLLELFSLCNKFEYYNFMACVVIVSALLYYSYKWSNNHFCSLLAFIITQKEKKTVNFFLFWCERSVVIKITIYVHFAMVVFINFLGICGTCIIIIMVNKSSSMQATQKMKKTGRGKKKVIPVKPISC